MTAALLADALPPLDPSVYALTGPAPLFKRIAELEAALRTQAAALAEREAKPLLILSSGEYSDYCWDGPFRPLKTFTIGEALEAFKAQWKPDPAHKWKTRPNPLEFVGWLSSNGYIEDVGATEVMVGGYGEIVISKEAAALKFDPLAAAPSPNKEQTK